MQMSYFWNVSSYVSKDFRFGELFFVLYVSPVS